MANQGEPAPIGFEMHDREAAAAGQNGEFGFCGISVVQYTQVGRTSNSFLPPRFTLWLRRGVGHYDYLYSVSLWLLRYLNAVTGFRCLFVVLM